MECKLKYKEVEERELDQVYENFENDFEYFEYPKRIKEKTFYISADDNNPEHGTTNYYGTVQKRRANTNKFHPR